MCANKFSLEGKNVLVICPENNWGPEVVQGLKAAGCKVFLAGPNQEAMEAMGAEGVYVYDHCTKAQALAMAEAAKGCTCPPNFPICTCGEKPLVKIISRKPITASDAELEANPRSRSAKLRICEKI